MLGVTAAMGRLLVSLCLVAALAALGLWAAPRAWADDEEAAAEAAAEDEGFNFESVARLARERARAPFAGADGATRDFLRKMTREEWSAITFDEGRRLWRDEDAKFQAGFFHPGFIFDQPPEISVVRDGEPEPLPFDQGLFTYPDQNLKDKLAALKLGFAGFRLLYPLYDNDRVDEAVSFLGATHFRGLARKSRYGLEARGLILDPGAQGGEEYPYFRHFWLVEPPTDAYSMTVLALLDSPSLTGAYAFTVTPGTSTVMDVKARLFRREGASFPETVGLAPIGSMYLFSEKEGPGGNWRPEVHNSDILLFATKGGQWYRRPLSNPKKLTVNSYDLPDPFGFGLMQSDPDFDHYQDLDARYDLRPSLWIEPQGDWGPGRLELIEIPGVSDINSNIIAFWRPDQIAGGELDMAYKMYWMPAGQAPHMLGRATQTRRADWNDGGSQFIIDFEGGELGDIPAESGLASVVDVSDGVTAQEKTLRQNPVTGGWRLEFKVRPPDATVVDSLKSARGGQRALHLSAVLKKGENFPDALTETWIYDLAY